MLMVTAETTVDKILSAYPHSATVFIAHATSCVGCWMSGFHTLAEVAALYNIQVEELLDELRDAITHKDGTNAEVDTLDH